MYKYGEAKWVRLLSFSVTFMLAYILIHIHTSIYQRREEYIFLEKKEKEIRKLEKINIFFVIITLKCNYKFLNEKIIFFLKKMNNKFKMKNF